MRAMTATKLGGYEDLGLVDAPRPTARDGAAVVRVTAAGVTPLEHTILSGGHPRAKAPLVLGNEGAGVIEEAGASGLAVGTRVAFTGSYGVAENGSWQDCLAVRPDDLMPIPDGIPDVTAASLPVAYLTAAIALAQAGFTAGQTVFAPAIGGSVGNATYQLAKALGAARVISTAGSAHKAAKARELGFDNVIDLGSASIRDGIHRLTEGRGADIVIESLGGSFIGEALAALALRGTLVTLGYTAGRTSSINITDLIWKRARMFGFALVDQTRAVKLDAWTRITSLIRDGAISPIVEQTYPLEQAGAALRHLHERRPFGKIVLEL